MNQNYYGFKQGGLYQISNADGLVSIIKISINKLSDFEFIDRNQHIKYINYQNFFIFVDIIEIDNLIFSKILVDDSVALTYNPYLLQRFVNLN